jgi:hypothetical protein
VKNSEVPRHGVPPQGLSLSANESISSICHIDISGAKPQATVPRVHLSILSYKHAEQSYDEFLLRNVARQKV